MKASEILDMPVISIADAARLGKVSDLLLDVANLQAGAVVLKTDGGQSMLPFGSIRNFGSDAVTVESTAAAHDAAEPTATGSMRGFRDLKGLPVANAQGTHLGEVTDLEIDVQGGRLIALMVHKGGVLGVGGKTLTVDSSAIRGIGEKLVTVDMPAEEAERESD